jgi:hypothetical protein
MNPRLQELINSRRLEPSSASDTEVATRWKIAIGSLETAELPGINVRNAVGECYQGALQAATAVLRCAGYTVIGAAHHHSTFAAVAALDAGELSQVARELNRLRARRHEAIYDWEIAVTPEDFDILFAHTRALFRHAHAYLTAARPALASTLQRPPD